MTEHKRKQLIPTREVFHILVATILRNDSIELVLIKKGGNPFKASLIGKTVGYNALQKRILFSKQSMKDKAVYNKSRHVISSLLTAKSGQRAFEKELAKNGISVLLRKNDEGRIYGVTFIDHQERVVFNGSRLGKEFSANMFHELFSKSDKTQSLEQSLDRSFTNDLNEQDSASEILGGIFSLEQHGDNYEEIAFTHRMKCKKKKRKGFGL